MTFFIGQKTFMCMHPLTEALPKRLFSGSVHTGNGQFYSQLRLPYYLTTCSGTELIMQLVKVIGEGRHQNTQQRITKDDKSKLVSLHNPAFFYYSRVRRGLTKVAYSLQKDIKVYRKQQLDVITRNDL